MGHGLSSSGAIVNSDVEACRIELGLSNCLGLIQQFQQPSAFDGAELEKRADMPTWNDETVARRNWVPISNPYRVFVASPNSLGGQQAKGTTVIAH